jgi:hypothetical protein
MAHSECIDVLAATVELQPGLIDKRRRGASRSLIFFIAFSSSPFFPIRDAPILPAIEPDQEVGCRGRRATAKDHRDIQRRRRQAVCGSHSARKSKIQRNSYFFSDSLLLFNIRLVSLLVFSIPAQVSTEWLNHQHRRVAERASYSGAL